MQYLRSYQDGYQLDNAASIGNKDAGTMSLYPTQPHYPDTELTTNCIILLMPRVKLGSDKHRFL